MTEIEDYEDDDIVSAFVNIVKRITKLEKEVSIINAILNITTSKHEASEVARSKWEEWARKIIFKIIEWLIVVISAIVGIKAATGGL